jgi:hypothetical protein
MDDFRNRPKGTFNQKAKPTELYALTQYWKSDLEFYKKDLDFLNKLIDNYFIWIAEKQHIDMVRDIEIGLLENRKQCVDLLEKVTRHRQRLAKWVTDETLEESRIIRAEHEHLEDEIADFVKAFRKQRKETFRITEYVVDAEKLSGYLKH